MIVRCGLGELGLIAVKCVLDCTKSLREDARFGGREQLGQREGMLSPQKGGTDAR